MPAKKEFFCNECEAEFKIIIADHAANTPVSFCPFCGSELDERDSNDLEELQ